MLSSFGFVLGGGGGVERTSYTDEALGVYLCSNSGEGLEAFV